ncbi:major histocompatibility complex class I-related gene protein-like isoform X1 [Xiphophorus hellerii]|uniref:major histocompatibility complex class I-related gene protein-like isoform X1 n=1 Tax=Xiphophorus hellerii TaxID=8084 RepID=UPI0013B3C0F8|nr:major histocompatibility complex class I-related gene protein-like isoform X1 [Xiphophorus hellerii]
MFIQVIYSASEKLEQIAIMNYFGLLLLFHVASSVKHSLRYFLTATYGAEDFPEFVGAATVDEVQMGYCDSNIKTAKPKQDWMRKLIERNPEHLEWYSQKCLRCQHVFRANIDNLKRRLNLTEGPYILQRMDGCEWDDETGDFTGFNQYGFNGEDFLALDLKTLTWIAPNPQAVLTKLIWDAEKARLEHNKNYYSYECPDWLKNYIRHGKSFLQRTESPSVSLLQKTPSSVVSCHATGFFPDRAEMFWRKDGEQIHKDVEKGEILLNNDGTFQMSVELNVSSVPPESWKRYDCVFQLSGVGDDIKITLDKSAIRTNWAYSPEFPAAPVAGIVGGFLLILLLLGIAVVVLRMKKSTDEEKQYSDFQLADGED